MPQIRDVAVVGAGIAGMQAAATLAQSGLDVAVFEKSRGPGGRSSSRRQEELRFDHGAPYFEAQDPEFSRAAQRWVEQGQVLVWPCKIQRRRGQTVIDERQASPYLAVPRMSALARWIGQGLDCSYATRIETLERDSEGSWHLHAGTQSFRARALLVTAPPPQTIALLRDHAPALCETLGQVQVLPTWTLMLTPTQPLFSDAWDRVEFEEHPSVASMTAQHRKPQRPPQPAWVVHATTNFSQRHEEQSADWARDALLGDLAELTQRSIDPACAQAHRWRYARVRQTHTAPFLSARDLLVYYAGDSCLRGDLESAYLSGTQAALDLIRSLT